MIGRVAAWGAAGLGLCACLDDGPVDDGPRTLTSVEYVLAWDLAEAERVEDGLRFATSEGREVVLESAYLTSYAVQLASCELSEPESAEASGGDGPVAARRWRPRIVRRAWAGHGEGWEPSAWTTPVVEDMMAARSRALGTVGFPPNAACRVHYLMGPGPEAVTLDLPDDVDMVETTLHLKARHRAAGSAEWSALRVETSLAWGALVDAPALETGTSSHVVVTVRRRIDRIFDGVALDDDTDSVVDDQALVTGVLRNLADGTTFEIDG